MEDKPEKDGNPDSPEEQSFAYYQSNVPLEEPFRGGVRVTFVYDASHKVVKIIKPEQPPEQI